MLVTIVAVPNADNTGLDLDRLEKVEDLHPEIARNMLDAGTARQPSAEELVVYRDAQAKASKARSHDTGDDLPSGPTASYGDGEVDTVTPDVGTSAKAG